VASQADSLLKLVAKLYHIDGLDQRQISELIGLSRPQISRLLTKARQKGVVHISVEDYDPRNRDLEDRLRVIFHLNWAIVINTGEANNPDTVRRNLGYFAAPFVSDLTRSNAILGVAGGRTIYEVVRHMAPAAGTRGVTVVQLMGNIGPSVSSSDAIELSRRLAQAFGGTFYTVNAPAFAPDAHTRDQFMAHEHVRTVWRLFGMMDMALVGLGSLSDSSFISHGMLDQEGLRELRARGAVGEICGRFFDADGQECDSDYRNRVISVDLDVLRQKPEVIAVTYGADRTEAVRAALTGRLVKSLIIDEAGAIALLRDYAAVPAQAQAGPQGAQDGG
jgi:deoxyribonucleoside regulator